ncbi:hypothetical protein Y032_0011g1465 [Ancylostoma ceylanicum]|uniref:BAR domain-containing protein n=1 Tax=Ancylostoma ceylanicum TaxID=53326 RepID=A0A016VET7_9BILA|nr:hypothetical protein Y032_0011g1465 [Ancylostoma ceylanicum]
MGEGGKGFSFRRKFLFKIQEKVGNIEETQMTPEFNNDMQKYDSYHNSVSKLVDLLEAVNQPDPNVLATGRVECPPDEDPLDKMKKALEAFQEFLSPEKVGPVAKICGILENAAKCKRDYQIKKRACIRHLRRFDTLEYKTLVENRENFNQLFSEFNYHLPLWISYVEIKTALFSVCRPWVACIIEITQGKRANTP